MNSSTKKLAAVILAGVLGLSANGALAVPMTVDIDSFGIHAEGSWELNGPTDISESWSGDYHETFEVAAGEYDFNILGEVWLAATSWSVTVADLVVTSGTFGSLRFQVFNDGSAFVVASSVPEPTSLVLLGTGLLGLFGVMRRRTMAS